MSETAPTPKEIQRARTQAEREGVSTHPYLERQTVTEQQIRDARATTKVPRMHANAIGAAMQSVREMNAIHPSEPTALDIDLTPTKEEEVAMNKKWGILQAADKVAFRAYEEAKKSGNEEEIKRTASTLSDVRQRLGKFEEKHGLASSD